MYHTCKVSRQGGAGWFSVNYTNYYLIAALLNLCIPVYIRNHVF